jgi:FMN phosphatase YigB (HAD superfamily)
VTNGLSKLQRDKLKLTGLSGYFASVVVAEDVGAAKPDTAMFHETLGRLELSASEAVMVGNDLERDIVGGALGWARDDPDFPRGRCWRSAQHREPSGTRPPFTVRVSVLTADSGRVRRAQRARPGRRR